MTYKKLVKEIDEHTKNADGVTLIDGLILEYGKITTVDALDYVAYFINTKTFLEMGYWHTKSDNYQQQKLNASKKIMQALKTIYPKFENEINYYLSI